MPKSEKEKLQEKLDRLEVQSLEAMNCNDLNKAADLIRQANELRQKIENM